MRIGGNPYLLLVLATLFWSGNHVLGRAIVGVVPPFCISTVRWLVPAVILAALARRHLVRDWPLMRAQWQIMLCLGVTGGALFSALQYVGLQYTSALNVSMLNSLVPVLIIVVGVVLFRDRIAVRQAAGVAISLVGVLVIIAHGTLDNLRVMSFNKGDLIMVVSMTSFAIYASCLRLRPPIHWLSFLFALAVISATFTLPFAIWESLTGPTFQPTAFTAVAIVYFGVFPSLLAFAAWNRGADIIGAARAAPFLHLVPLFTAVFSIAVLDEGLALFHLVGFGTILFGVWLAQQYRTQTARLTLWN